MSPDDRWRLFVAVPIGDELRDVLASAVQRWRDRPDLAGLRWSDPEAWHLTLLFLGATDPSHVASIASTLDEIAPGHDATTLEAGGLGGFGSAARARVAWYGVADPDNRLRNLARDTRAELAPDEPSRFRPHITLARARNEPVDLRPWIADAAAPTGRLAVDEVRLVRSHLGGGPARDEPLHGAPLGARVHV